MAVNVAVVIHVEDLPAGAEPLDNDARAAGGENGGGVTAGLRYEDANAVAGSGIDAESSGIQARTAGDIHDHAAASPDFELVGAVRGIRTALRIRPNKRPVMRRLSRIPGGERGKTAGRVFETSADGCVRAAGGVAKAATHRRLIRAGGVAVSTANDGGGPAGLISKGTAGSIIAAAANKRAHSARAMATPPPTVA